MKRLGISVVAVGLLLCVAVAITPIPGCGHLIRVVDIGAGLLSSGGCSERVGAVYDVRFLGCPIAGATWGDVTAYYCDPTYFELFGLEHWGIDFSAPEGTPVLATIYGFEYGDVVYDTGVVVRAGYHVEMGYNVKVCAELLGDWDVGACAVYMHLSDVAVSPGERVRRGDVLGWVGSTGFSTGPHLHYQIEVGGGAVDPAPLVALSEDLGLGPRP